jgi:hypothetical protein
VKIQNFEEEILDSVKDGWIDVVKILNLEDVILDCVKDG